jgi:hypothetical protein
MLLVLNYIYMQYKGATDEDGRSPSIWDNFTHEG